MATKIETKKAPATPKKVPKSRKKRKGSGFVASLIIILIAAGAVFWFGWVQFELGEGDYGVVYTKTNGYETEVLTNGEFAWRWQGLLPTNLILHVFKLETRTIDIERNGVLPSGELYASMAGDGVSFNWDITGKIVYRMNPDSLPALVADGLSSTELDTFYSDFESKMNSEVVRLIADEIDKDVEVPMGERLKQFEKDIKAKAASIDDRIEIVEASVLEWTYPDMALYKESRRLYLDLMSKRQVILTEVGDSAVRREDIQGNRLDLLEEYGRVLNEYPVLLDLFALDGNPGTNLLPPIEQTE